MHIVTARLQGAFAGAEQVVITSALGGPVFSRWCFIELVSHALPQFLEATVSCPWTTELCLLTEPGSFLCVRHTIPAVVEV